MKVSSVQYMDNPAEQKPDGFYLRINDIRLALGLPFSKLDELIQGNDEKFPARFIDCLIKMALRCQVSCDYLLGMTDTTMPYSRSKEMPVVLDTSRVKHLRKETKTPLKVLCKATQQAQTTYYQKEEDNNRYAFTIYDIYSLARFYNTSTDYLLHLTDEKAPFPEGCHEFIPLTAETKIRIQNALGLNPVTNAGPESFCVAHFRLKEIRLRKKLPVKTVAEAIHVNHNTYEKYEAKPHTIPIYIAIQLADYFSVSLDYLVGRTDHTNWYKGSAYSGKKKWY